MARTLKRVRATMFDDAFEVEVEKPTTQYHDELGVWYEGEKIGYITAHTTQSERKITGTRLVSRGATFTAWAQRTLDDDRFDYYAQHRSQSEALRRLVSDWKRSKR